MTVSKKRVSWPYLAYICQWICVGVTAICIFCIGGRVLTHEPKMDIQRIFIVWHLVKIWKSCAFYYTFGICLWIYCAFIVLVLCKFNYADEFQMNMPHDYIGICLLWRLLWWTGPNPPHLLWWVQHEHGGSALDIHANPLDLVAKKLDWLEAELEILLWVWLLHSDLPTVISSQINTQHWRQKLSQRLHVQGSSCRWNWAFIGCRYSFFEFLYIFGIICVYKQFMFIYNFSVNVN